MLSEGQKVKIGRKQFTVVRVGKECKLVDRSGNEIWRHSRTLEKLTAAPAPARSRKGPKALSDLLTLEQKADTAVLEILS
jgi:hypothetical protein